MSTSSQDQFRLPEGTLSGGPQLLPNVLKWVEEAKPRKKRKNEDKKIDVTVDDSIMKDIANMLQDSMFIGGTGPAQFGNMNTAQVRFGSGDLSKIISSALPVTKEGRIEKAFEFFEDDDLLNGIVKTKKRFCTQGFCLNQSQTAEAQAMQVIDEESEQEDPIDGKPKKRGPKATARFLRQAKTKTMLDKVSVEWNFYGIAKELAKNWFVSDSMILYWKLDLEEPTRFYRGNSTLPGVQQIIALSPSDCHWDNSNYEDRLMWKMDKEVFDRIQSTKCMQKPNAAKIIKELLDEGWPKDWIEEALGGNRYMKLDKALGHRWIIRTDSDEHKGFACPSLFTVFLELESRRCISQGDFAAAYMMKHFIQLVKLGESIQTGPRAGSKENWASVEEIEKMQQKIGQVAKTLRLVTNHTVTFEYIFPPKEMFDTAKYDSPEKKILNQQECPEVVIRGSGTTNGSGYIGTKRLITCLEDCRDTISAIMRLFFSTKEIASNVFPAEDIEGSYVNTTFDQNVLKDPRILLDEIKMLMEQNIMGAETALKETNRDPDRVRSEKQADIEFNKSTGVYEPLSEGDTKISPRLGKKTNEDTPADESTRTRFGETT